LRLGFMEGRQERLLRWVYETLERYCMGHGEGDSLATGMGFYGGILAFAIYLALERPEALCDFYMKQDEATLLATLAAGHALSHTRQRVDEEHARYLAAAVKLVVDKALETPEMRLTRELVSYLAEKTCMRARSG
jgi:hypothetical protein